MTSSAPPVCVTVDVVHFATVPTPHDYVFRPDGRPLTKWVTGTRAGDDAIPGPCLWFSLEHPEHGRVVVDTGLHPRSHANVGDFGRAMAFVFKGLRPVGAPFDQQLLERGVDPASVDRVLMTHLHVDHTSGMRLLPNARFTVTAQEWDAAHARGAALKGYTASHLPAADRMDLIDLTREGPHGPFAHARDLYGDGSVRLLWTPGHTTGHLSLLLRTAPDTEVLLVGDAAYALRSIDEQILPLLTADDDQARDTLRRLHEFRCDNPDAIVVPSHDPEAWHRLGATG